MDVVSWEIFVNKITFFNWDKFDIFCYFQFVKRWIGVSIYIFKTNNSGSFSFQYTYSEIFGNTLTPNSADIWKVWMKTCIIQRSTHHFINKMSNFTSCLLQSCLCLKTLFATLYFHFVCSSKQTPKYSTKQDIGIFSLVTLIKDQCQIV